MALNIPNLSPSVSPIVEGISRGNALSDQMMKTRMDALKNQYYAPDMQGQIDYRNALMQGQNIQNQYMPDKLRLSNQNQALVNQFYAPNIQSEMALRNSETNKTNQMLPLDMQNQKNINDWYARDEQAKIDASKSLSDYRALGGGSSGGLGVGGKEQLFFNKQVALDNPQLKTDEQKREAANVLAGGGTALIDGTPLNPMSPETRASLDRITKYGTTAPLITQGVRANQAEAELNVLNDYATKALKPYGDTIMGMSPAQVADSFKSDDASQERLGKFVASQALQYEAAQNRIRLASGQPSVTSTEDLMKLSGQVVNAKYPMMSYKARKAATDYLDKALKEGLKARQNVGVSPSMMKNAGQSNSVGNDPLGIR